jgi:hypothetical protein
MVAFAASFALGAALGVLAAMRARGSLRPCRRLREHGAVAGWSGGSLALAAAPTIAIASAGVSYQRALLAVTCGAIALVVGAAVWLMLVEADDGDTPATDDEPEWWPTFERELQEWARRRSVLSR